MNSFEGNLDGILENYRMMYGKAPERPGTVTALCRESALSASLAPLAKVTSLLDYLDLDLLFPSRDSSLERKTS